MFIYLYTKIQKNPQEILSLAGFYNDPYGIRTRVTAVKGRCLNRLTKGPKFICLATIARPYFRLGPQEVDIMHLLPQDAVNLMRT